MNCEKCQQLMSEFVDNTLSTADCSAVSDHLLVCPACYELQLDLSAIVYGCRELEASDESRVQVLRLPFKYGQVL
jgi:anti-sigma factor RsiW